MTLRCEGRYPVPKTAPPRDEPFDVTYRCEFHTGHQGPCGPYPMTPNPPPPAPVPTLYRELADAVSALDVAAADEKSYDGWTAAKWRVFNAAVRLVKETPAEAPVPMQTEALIQRMLRHHGDVQCYELRYGRVRTCRELQPNAPLWCSACVDRAAASALLAAETEKRQIMEKFIEQCDDTTAQMKRAEQAEASASALREALATIRDESLRVTASSRPADYSAHVRRAHVLADAALRPDAPVPSVERQAAKETPPPAGEWWGVIGPRGMPCLFGKHREDVDGQADDDERIALFRVEEVAASESQRESVSRQGALVPLPEAAATPTPSNNGHIDSDCEVVRGVGWMCTCQTPEEKADDARYSAECEAERDAACAPPVQETAPAAQGGEELATARRWHMAFNAAKPTAGQGAAPPDFDQLAIDVASRAGSSDILPYIKEALRKVWTDALRPVDVAVENQRVLLAALTDAAQTARNYHMLFHDETWNERRVRWEAAIASALDAANRQCRHGHRHATPEGARVCGMEPERVHLHSSQVTGQSASLPPASSETRTERGK